MQQNFGNILLEPHHNGQLHSWNVAYQRILPGAFTAEVAYVGNRAKDDWGSENINAGYVVGADRAGQPLFVKYGRMSKINVPAISRSIQNKAKNTHNARARFPPAASVSANTMVMMLKLTRQRAMKE